jgi:hypothetical protein
VAGGARVLWCGVQCGCSAGDVRRTARCSPREGALPEVRVCCRGQSSGLSRVCLVNAKRTSPEQRETVASVGPFSMLLFVFSEVECLNGCGQSRLSNQTILRVK